MKTLAVALLTIATGSLLCGCSGEEALKPEESMAGVLKDAKIDPNGKSKDGGAATKVGDKPAGGAATGQ